MARMTALSGSQPRQLVEAHAGGDADHQLAGAAAARIGVAVQRLAPRAASRRPAPRRRRDRPRGCRWWCGCRAFRAGRARPRSGDRWRRSVPASARPERSSPRTIASPIVPQPSTARVDVESSICGATIAQGSGNGRSTRNRRRAPPITDRSDENPVGESSDRSLPCWWRWASRSAPAARSPPAPRPRPTRRSSAGSSCGGAATTCRRWRSSSTPMRWHRSSRALAQIGFAEHGARALARRGGAPGAGAGRRRRRLDSPQPRDDRAVARRGRRPSRQPGGAGQPGRRRAARRRSPRRPLAAGAADRASPPATSASSCAPTATCRRRVR